MMAFRTIPGQSAAAVNLQPSHSLHSIFPVIGLCGLLAVVFFSSRRNEPAAEVRWAGLARTDVTPGQPVRLTGYGGRPSPSNGVAQRLWAKALALGGDGGPPALWLTLDTCGLTREFWLELRNRLTKRTGIPPERIVLTISHTHAAPATTGWAPFVQPENIPPAETAAIDDYTRSLLDKLESVAVEALADRFPARLSWSEGRATFAANRRPGGGPVDHALPVLKVEDDTGKLRALITSYACHCTTCSGAILSVCGDWAGFAQEALERDHPGAQAMIAIGCAGDADPNPRVGADGGLALAKQHGESIAAAIRPLLAAAFHPLTAKLEARHVDAPLPFGPPFTRDELKQRASDQGIVGRHARHWAAQLDARQPPPSQLDYEITGWNFGDQLALLFLPGEVVVDYSLRLKRELDSRRLWLNAYSNWVPCYIPSRRILTEGGYEAESSLWYYNRPCRLAPECEDTVINAARLALPKSFAVPKPVGNSRP